MADKKKKAGKASYTSKGQRIGSMKTAGYHGKFISTMREKIVPGWSDKERASIAAWIQHLVSENRVRN